MKRKLQYGIVQGLESLCGLLDKLPAFHVEPDRDSQMLTIRLYRYGQWGCRMGIGLANYSLKLEQRWHVIDWVPSSEHIQRMAAEGLEAMRSQVFDDMSTLCFAGKHERCTAEWCSCPHHQRGPEPPEGLVERSFELVRDRLRSARNDTPEGPPLS